MWEEPGAIGGAIVRCGWSQALREGSCEGGGRGQARRQDLGPCQDQLLTTPSVGAPQPSSPSPSL